MPPDAHTQTTTKGTGTFVVVWAGAAARSGDLSQSVTSRASKTGLVLQIESLRLGPSAMSRSVTGRAGFAVQMLQIETIESRGSKTTTKGIVNCPLRGGLRRSRRFPK